MVSTKSSLENHVGVIIGCPVRIDDEACGYSLAEFRGTIKHKKGVTIDLISKPLGSPSGNPTFPISIAVARMFALRLVLSEQPQKLPNVGRIRS